MTEKQYRATLAKAKQGDIVRVRWRDSTRIAMGWDDAAAYIRHLDVVMSALEETAGYFVASNEGFVLVVLNMSIRPEGDVSMTDAMAIPHEAIRTFEVLVEGSKLDRSPSAA